MSNLQKKCEDPDTKDHGVDMGPTWVLSAPGGPHVGSMNLDFWGTVYAVRTLSNVPLEPYALLSAF